MDVLEAFHWFKADVRPRTAIVLINLVGIVYGFYYYLPQFQVTPLYAWPLVPESPMAVLLAEIPLLLYYAGRRYDWLDALAVMANVQVGLWTVLVLLYYAPSFQTFAFTPEGTLNFVLMWGHLGMAVEAMVFLHDLRPLSRRTAGLLLVGFLASDWLDYLLPWQPSYLLHTSCMGLRPYTVPCIPGKEQVLTVVTFLLTFLAWGLVLWAGKRTYPPVGAPAAATGA